MQRGREGGCAAAKMTHSQEQRLVEPGEVQGEDEKEKEE